MKQKQKQQNVIDAKKILIDLIPLFNANSEVKKVDDLMKPEIKKQVMEAIQRELNVGQGHLFSTQIIEEAGEIYEKFVAEFKKNIIEIPRMDLVQGEITAGFASFDLKTDGLHYDQMKEEIIRR